MNTSPLQRRLTFLAAEYGLPDSAVPRFEHLLAALAAEPDPHTTISDPASAVDWHIADSLAALEVSAIRDASTVIDIGSGAGFPGLPLAIALPQTQIDLAEAASRKCAVIERLMSAAGLTNARAVHLRAEEWAGRHDRPSYDAATARAVGPLAVLVEYAAPLLKVGGTLVAWKGRPNTAEEQAAAQAAQLVGLQSVEVRKVRPFDTAEARHLHLYLKHSETPERFPRRPGAAAKRPLA